MLITTRPPDEAKSSQSGTSGRLAGGESRRILRRALATVTSKYERPFDSNLLFAATSIQISSQLRP